MINKENSVVWIITLFLLLSFGVLIIMHPAGFSSSAGTVFTGIQNWGALLSGSGYKGAGATANK